MKWETDDGSSSCSNFPKKLTGTELAANKPVLPEIEHLKGKISDKEQDSLRAVLNRNSDVFSKLKADIGCCIFIEHEIEIEEGSVPQRERARRMTPHKWKACRKEIEMLMEYDMIEPSKSSWACGVVMAKKKGGQRRFCCDFRYLNAVTSMVVHRAMVVHNMVVLAITWWSIEPQFAQDLLLSMSSRCLYQLEFLPVFVPL